jgi:hypothetical protein
MEKSRATSKLDERNNKRCGRERLQQQQDNMPTANTKTKEERFSFRG